MPHRILASVIASPVVATVLIVVDTLIAGAIMIGNIEITKSDIIGPHGLVLCAVGAVIILWLTMVRRDQKEDDRRTAEAEARERRHAEILELQRENAERILTIATKQAATQERTTNAIRWMASEMSKRPCLSRSETSALKNMADDTDG